MVDVRLDTLPQARRLVCVECGVAGSVNIVPNWHDGVSHAVPFTRHWKSACTVVVTMPIGRVDPAVDSIRIGWPGIDTRAQAGALLSRAVTPGCSADLGLGLKPKLQVAA
jgi:hypothetical protein